MTLLMSQQFRRSTISTFIPRHFQLPPFPEQHAIADFLDRETGKLDRLAAKVEEAVERLTGIPHGADHGDGDGQD